MAPTTKWWTVIFSASLVRQRSPHRSLRRPGRSRRGCDRAGRTESPSAGFGPLSTSSTNSLWWSSWLSQDLAWPCGRPGAAYLGRGVLGLCVSSSLWYSAWMGWARPERLRAEGQRVLVGSCQYDSQLSMIWYSPVPLAQPCTHRTGYMYIKEFGSHPFFSYPSAVANGRVGSDNGIESLTREFGSSSYWMSF